MSSPSAQPPHPPAEKVGGMRVKAPSRPSGKEPHDEQPLIANDPSKPLVAEEHRVPAVIMDGAHRDPQSNPSQRFAPTYPAPVAHQPGRPKHDPNHHLFQPNRQ